MTTIARPNKEALTKVIDIYRDAMRPLSDTPPQKGAWEAYRRGNQAGSQR